MKHLSRSGAALAAAALSLAISGAINAPAQAKSGDLVYCGGANACKGKSDCHSYTNSCKGQNACKGQGWRHITASDCTAAGGKVVWSN